LSLFGIHLTLLIGPTIPVPAPLSLTENIVSVEVTNRDEGRDGFQVTFSVGRGGVTDLLDYQLLNNPLLMPFNRVIILVTIGVVPQVLIDGIIMHQQLKPSNEPGRSTLTITGDDLSVLMDMEQETETFPNQPDEVIVLSKLAPYAQYGIAPTVIPAPSIDVPMIVDWTPGKHSTDYKYIQELAKRNDYVFYITYTPVPGVTTGYWGPSARAFPTSVQSSLCVNMGRETNVSSIDFQNDVKKPYFLSGSFRDRDLGTTIPIETFASTLPPLSSEPTWVVNYPNVERRLFQANGLNALEAFTRAQAETDASVDTVTATGELDSLSYGGVLRARSLVGVRGVGYSYDGIYYVKEVSHHIKIGEYTQSFTLSRDGLGSLTPVVPP
jgi:hypothetical protein